MYRLRDAMHLHYRDLLREKVQKQRQQIRERSLELQKQTEKPRGQVRTKKQDGFTVPQVKLIPQCAPAVR